MITNFQKRVIAILQESPNGLMSNEIAERFGTTAGKLSSRLSKLAAYGIIGKARSSHGRNVYRALTYEPGRVRLRGAYSAVLPSFFGTTRARLMMQSWVASLRARSSSSRSALNPGRLTFLNSSLTDFSI